MRAHCHDPIPDPPLVPEGCAAITRKALQKEREHRYARVNEMIADLQAVLDL